MYRKHILLFISVMAIILGSLQVNAKEYRAAADVKIFYDVADINNVQPNDVISGSIVLIPTDNLKMLRYEILEVINAELDGNITNTFYDISENEPVKTNFIIKIKSVPVTITIHCVTETNTTSAAGNKVFVIGKEK